MPTLTGRQYAAGRKLARRLDLPPDQLFLVLEYGAAAFYGSYAQPKSGGGTRIIHVPHEPLVTIQQAILKRYFSCLPVSPIAHGCVAGRGIESNAFPHRKARSMVGFDLKDAYNQASFTRSFIQTYHHHYTTSNGEVIERWCSQRKQPWDILPMELAVLEIVSDLVDIYSDYKEVLPHYKLVLPQGAHTSPALFNFACQRMDARLEHLASNVGGVVTRFVDNIVFSWENDEVDRPVYSAIRRIIEKSGFKVNERKTVAIRNGNRNGVPLRFPGVHIIDGDLYIPRKKLRHLRMALHCAGKAHNDALYQGIKGYALQVEAQMPPQLRGVYGKARADNPRI